MKYFLPVVICILLACPAQVTAQCAMCKAVAESNVENKSNQVGLGINKGVLYLLSVPYVLAGVGYLLWRRHKKMQRDIPSSLS